MLGLDEVESGRGRKKGEEEESGKEKGNLAGIERGDDEERHGNKLREETDLKVERG